MEDPIAYAPEPRVDEVDESLSPRSRAALERTLTTVAVLSEARHRDIVAYNAFLAEPAITDVTENTVRIPVSYADDSLFKFQRVLRGVPDDAQLFEDVRELFDPTELGRSVAVVTYGQSGLSKGNAFTSSKTRIGLIVRAVTEVFERVSAMEAARGPATVFLSAYTSLGGSHTTTLDTEMMTQAGVVLDTVRVVEVAHGVRTQAVAASSCLAALSIIQTVFNCRKRALKKDPNIASQAHFYITLRVEWAGGVWLCHFVDVAALEDAWTKDCYHQHDRHEWRTTCTRDPGPELPKSELKALVARNTDLMDFERLVQARHARQTSFIPSKANVLSSVLGSSFTRSGRAAVLLYVSPFLADKKLALRTLGLGKAIMSSAEVEVKAATKPVEAAAVPEPAVPQPSTSSTSEPAPADTDPQPRPNVRADEPTVELHVFTKPSVPFASFARDVSGLKSPIKFQTTTKQLTEQVAMYARHAEVANSKQAKAEDSARRSEAAVARMAASLEELQYSRDVALAKLEGLKKKMIAEQTRHTAVAAQMKDVQEREAALARKQAEVDRKQQENNAKMDNMLAVVHKLTSDNKQLKLSLESNKRHTEAMVRDYTMKLEEQNLRVRSAQTDRSDTSGLLAQKDREIAAYERRVAELVDELQDMKLVMERAVGHATGVKRDTPTHEIEMLKLESERLKERLDVEQRENVQLQSDLFQARAAAERLTETNAALTYNASPSVRKPQLQ